MSSFSWFGRFERQTLTILLRAGQAIALRILKSQDLKFENFKILESIGSATSTIMDSRDVLPIKTIFDRLALIFISLDRNILQHLETFVFF